MKVERNLHRTLTGIIALFIVLLLASWAATPHQHHPGTAPVKDTVPAKKKKEVNPEGSNRDLDKELKELDEARENLEELKDQDWNKIKVDIENALKNIDIEKIRLEVQRAIQKTDIEKINRNIQESIQNIDFDKIEKDVQNSLKDVEVNIDQEKIKEGIRKARQEIRENFDSEDLKKELEKVRNIDMKEVEKSLQDAKKEMEKVKININLEKLNIKKELENASVDIDKTREELEGYQQMIYAMEKDGLLDTKKDYKIEYRNGELKINDKKQGEEVLKKYKKYFKKEKVTISKEDDDLNIDDD